MNFETFDPTKGLYRASVIEEMQHSSYDMEASVWDYLTLGTVSAVTSAFVGIANTGISLGETLGLVDEGSQFDERSVIGNLWGQNAQDFYSQHKTGIDVVGLVAGSFVPGLGAVRALRAAQSAGRIWSPAGLTTGLRNPDILLDSPAVKAAKESVLRTGTSGLRNKQVRDSFMVGMQQQFMEAAVFDLSVTTFMNQNASLNPDDLTYFESFKNVGLESIPFIFVGGTIGGIVDGLRIRGAIKKNTEAEFARTGFLVPQLEGMTGMSAGDKLVELARAKKNHNELAEKLTADDWFGKRRYEEGASIIENHLSSVMKELDVPGNDGVQAVRAVFDEAVEGDLETLASKLANAKTFRSATVTDLREADRFYKRTMSPTGIVVASNLDEATLGFEEILRGFEKFIPEGAPELPVGELSEYMGSRLARNNGIAFLAGDNAPLDNLRVSAVTAGDGSQYLYIPDMMGINTSNISLSYKISKKFNEDRGIPFNLSEEEFQQYTLLHEIGHIKTNTTKVKNLVQNMAKEGKSKDLMVDLIEASIKRRRPNWEAQGIPVNSPKFDRQFAESLANELLYDQPATFGDGWKSYLGNLNELLADGAAYLSHPASREAAAKQFPTLAKFFNSNGSIAKSWDDTRAFYNKRTGEVSSSTLLGIQDVSPTAAVRITKKGMELQSPELKRTFKADPQIFTKIADKIADGSIDYLEYDAAWKMYSTLDFEDLAKVDTKLGRDGVIKVTEGNLPAMERLVTQSGDSDLLQQAFQEGRVRYNGAVVSRDQLRESLIQSKYDIRRQLLLQADNGGFNEHHISKILNMDVDRAMGLDTGEILLYGKKDFNSPEVFRVGYDQRNPLDYSVNSKSLAAVSIRKELVREERERAAAYALESDYEKIAEVKMDYTDAAAVATTEGRTGMIEAVRTAFNSIREKAAYVGKQVNQIKSKKIKALEEEMANYIQHFNKRENAGLRYELAHIDNLLRREWYHLAKSINPETGETVYHIVQKNSLQNFFREVGAEFDPAVLDELSDDILDYIKQTGSSTAPGAVQLSADVGRFYEHFGRKNAGYVDKFRQLGHARGKEPVLDDTVLYPPPRDLRTQKFFAFVQPNDFLKGSDSRNFMVFAETEAEYKAKVDLIKSKYGNKYNIITQEKRTEMAQLMKDYDRGLVFDELYFDAEMVRKGKASEILPNMDFNRSSTLDRYLGWMIRTEESILMSGVELQFDDVIQSLKSLDKELGEAKRIPISPKYKEQDTIWKDTVNLMLDRKSTGTALEQTFVKVNDYIGEYGSKIIDGALGSLRKSPGAPITSKDLQEFTNKLQKAGYNPPTLSVMEAVLSSPETTKSSTLPNAVRTLSGLVSTLMLRMDQAHSIMQILSTPILALPVIQEAQRALRGTENGKKLLDLTHVVNPASGDLEPTAAKLFGLATTKFFTKEGKEFLEQMRDRNIVSDYMIQYLDTIDISAFQGNKSIKWIDQKTNQVADFASKFSGFKFSEEFSRFQVAWAVKTAGELRGVSVSEMWPMISGAVDKVHGVYLGNQRAQLFQGVLGQSIGLYQTYFFNFIQNFAKYIGDGDKRQAVTMAAMQTSMFGIQSLPGFHQLNQMIGETNSGNLDLYSITGADDPKSTAAYMMYGLGSHALGFPVDFYSRGDLAVRHSTVIPTNVSDFPVVGTLAKAVANIYNTIDMGLEDDINFKQAMIHGLAHNGMNRPLQGLGNIARGAIMSNRGQINFDYSNYIDYNTANELNWGAMFARAIGTRPLNEAIIQGNYFRDAAYQANQRRAIERIAKRLQININDGTITNDMYRDMALEYESVGGNIQNFNAFWTRQLKNASKPTMQEFQREMMQDRELNRARVRMELEQSTTPPWEM